MLASLINSFALVGLCGAISACGISPPINYAVEAQNTLKNEFDALQGHIYICRCVEAEATNQGLLGKCLVADVILNRIESDCFPNTAAEVITAKNQFAVHSNGRMWRVPVTHETLKAVRLELKERTDSEIMYFSAGGYNPSCVPAYQFGDHYFGY